MFVVLVVIGYSLYDRYISATNKKVFQNAQTAINSIYNNAYKEIGHPDNAQLNSSCKRDLVEFGSGKFYCNLGTNFIYGVTNGWDANIKMAEIQNISKKSDFKSTKTLSSSLNDSVVTNSYYHTATDTYKFDNLDRTIRYIYDSPQLTSLSLRNTLRKPFEVTIGCSGLAKQQYYRLAY